MNGDKERPFELLRNKEGKPFSEETVRNWYLARAYVLKMLSKIEKEHPFSPDSDEHLHVVLTRVDERMMSIVRFVALYAHYLNFNEECADNESCQRTIISIVNTQNKDIKEILSKEEYLCNLPTYCKWVERNNVTNKDSYVDIEIHVVSQPPQKNTGEIMLVVNADEVEKFFGKVNDEVFRIDTRKAFYTSKMYDIGETIENLPAENIHDAKRYTMALNVYQYREMEALPEKIFEDKIAEGKQYKLKEMLSNVFCSDCFESRNNVISYLCKGKKGDVIEQWGEYNEVLSKSEHARWVAEKLIMGYRPFSEEEHHYDELLRVQFKSKAKLSRFHNSLKRNDDDLAHIDLCSYRDLRRINPSDMKYDSFLMLAIPKILEKVQFND
jgi:hypothetical protein